MYIKNNNNIIYMERGILTKYIENDVNTISVVKELPRKLYIILCLEGNY